MNSEIETNPFLTIYWPLDSALLWILTGDRTVVERHWKRRSRSGAELTETLAVEANWTNPIAVSFPDYDIAWTMLQEVLRVGGFEIVETPFARRTNALGKTEETQLPQTAISPEELGSLLPHEDRDQLILVSQDWRVSRGSNWSNLKG